MKIIERNDLRIGYIISYASPRSGQVLHGTIVHLGLGLAACHSVWVRCSGGDNGNKIECLLLEDVRGIISYAS